MSDNMHSFYYGAWDLTGYRGVIRLHNIYDYEYYHDIIVETLGM